ncbi:glycoside hydrolase family 99-like domain-containing protein [Frigoribacterium sp. UYMn621]|uniref:glycoside hydrolase family 99-like domain-containing protein n=1 Tax=Frigoribacterium sp. UYMn621 TaxID=3156343 RepID=UPI00339416BD
MIRPTVLAYYFPNWHEDKQNFARYGDGWNEWTLLKSARPRFEGHRQPRVPVNGYTDEADAVNMSHQIDLAADHGIDAFVFDFYWYADGPFLQGALDRGYLKADNRVRTSFALMWANHDWVDIFPAHHRDHPKIKRGAIARDVFDEMVDHVVATYFSQPEYLKVDGRPFFSIYEIGSLIEGLGGLSATVDALASFRAKTIAAGHPGLYLDATVWGFGILPGAIAASRPDELIRSLGFASASSYVWIHHSDLTDQTFPVGDWDAVADDALEAYETYARDLGVPFIPNVTVGWDSSPRTAQELPFTADQYPWYPVFDATPAQFERGLERVAAFSVSQHQPHPMITLNAWNEWTEGSALLPDSVHGTAYLDAVRRVFGIAPITENEHAEET